MNSKKIMIEDSVQGFNYNVLTCHYMRCVKSDEFFGFMIVAWICLNVNHEHRSMRKFHAFISHNAST